MSQAKPKFHDLCTGYHLSYNTMTRIAEQAKVSQKVMEDMYLGQPVSRSNALEILKAFSEAVDCPWTLETVNVSVLAEQENKSEIARLRQQIDDEITAARQGLQGLAQGRARHLFITKRMMSIMDHIEELSTIADPAVMEVVITKMGDFESTGL
jgi:hypothetical protein